MGRELGCMFAAAMAAAVVSSCFHDKAATLTVPSVLAVGTYGAVEFTDTCPGSKADLCGHETVQRIESITVDPLGMMEVIPVDQVPADLLRITKYQSAYAAHGLVAGKGQVCVQGLFSDGSHRRTCVPAAVSEIARVATTFTCGYLNDGVIPQPLVPPGMPLQFTANLQSADGTVLVGDILHPIDDMAFAALGVGTYLWSAPSSGSVSFGSRLDPTFSQTLATYVPTAVTAIHAGTTVKPPITLGVGQSMNLIVGEDVSGQRACVPAAITIRSDTPTVCAGPQGATTWTGGAGSGEVWFNVVAGGTCHLAFGVVGGSTDLGAIDVPYDVR